MPIDAEDPDVLVPEPEARPEEHAESPFVTIWESPRETIRRVVATDPRRWVNALFFASGFVGVLMSWPKLLTLLAQLEIEVPLVLVPVAAVFVGLMTILTGH